MNKVLKQCHFKKNYQNWLSLWNRIKSKIRNIYYYKRYKKNNNNKKSNNRYEPCHDKTNMIMHLRPAWIQTSLRIRSARLPTLLQVKKLIANSMGPDQAVQMRRLVWIHCGRKHIMLVLQWRGSNWNLNNFGHILIRYP
jgi:hypothetical protein